ncbi:MAG TPA: P1 family peptidase, partial [Actinomycetota bacterium]|nr:P1 family peptidase [Actinomycetota bacterium]
ALGEVVDEDGEVLAGALPEEPAAAEAPPLWPDAPTPNTTVAVVVTDARLSKERAHLLAGAGHDGLASAVRPAHTMLDGDTVFVLATGTVEAPQPVLERMVERAVAGAVRRAVRPEAREPDRPGPQQEEQGEDRP